MSLPFLNTAPGYDEELRNSVFFERGLHATSICGAVGAAVAVAMLQGQDEAGIASAAGIAASMGAGLLEANRTGGTVKRVHCGWAARCGVAAADLARHGLTGPPTVLEGRFGFLQAFCGDRAHPDAVVRGLGTDWELPRVVFKPYPCNHFTHAGVDAALRLRAQGLAPADVTAIELGVAKPVLRTIAGHPRPRHGRPPGTTRRSAAPTRSPRRCSAAASACPTRTSPTPPPVTPAASPWPPWCAASRTSAAARRSRTPSPPSCA
jgi:2-methylcitrate dehydratase PrpD